MVQKRTQATKAPAKAGKKEMKDAKVVVIDHSKMENLFSKVLKKVSGLTLTRNKRGAVAVRRGTDGIMFSSTKQGVFITHPIYQGSGKSRERVHACTVTGWENLSLLGQDEVTEEMLIARAKDPKTRAQYELEHYPNREGSGLVKKAEQVKARIAKAEAEAGGKTVKKAAAKREAKAVKAARKTPVAKAVRKAAEAKA